MTTCAAQERTSRIGRGAFLTIMGSALAAALVALFMGALLFASGLVVW